MQLASRESLAAARERLDEHAEAAPADALRTLAGDLGGVVGVLDSQPALRRALSDPALAADQRESLGQAVFGGAVSEPAQRVLRDLARARWSAPGDLTDAVEDLSRQATFAAAERSGELDDVEDELFRFARIVDRAPDLAAALTNASLPLERRGQLIDALIEDKVKPATRQLLDRAVAAPRERTLEHILSSLSQLAAARRHRYVASVRSAVEMSTAQTERLAAALGRIYRRDVVLQIEINPDLIGGLVVQVGDEVIDGSVASRLADAGRVITRR
ncbi:MAG: F0F1 ATP synthase subunit delta [Mycobacteriales bacterium]|nr:MAG: F0F1 ATP synthase subunit delta [Pseudonocardiales bacterium]